MTNIVEVANTTNYDKFVSVEGNRKISEANVQNIMTSIQTHGVISPIAVRKNKGKLEVYDGQHTLLACRRLQKPVDYIVYNKISDKAMISLNNASKKWSMEDYLNFGVKSGLPDYIYLNKIYQKEKIPLTALVIMYGGAYANKNFKSLEWTACQKDRGNKVLSYLNDMQRTYNLKQCRYARFIWGFCKIYDSGLYKHKRMMKQLSQCSQLMTKQANPEGYFKNIQMVYNYNRTTKHKVYFS